MKYNNYEIKGDVRPKGNGYEIRCRNLNQRKVGTMWYPDSGKTDKQNADALQFAVLQWQKLNKGTITQENRAFGDIAADWLDYLANKRTVGTIERYKDCSPRVIAEFGNCPDSKRVC
jgi:hypothetical protein